MYINKKKADLAVAALTITFEREKLIDFSEPFLNLGITVLYKKPRVINLPFFSFFSNFTIWLWISLIGAYLSNYIILL